MPNLEIHMKFLSSNLDSSKV